MSDFMDFARLIGLPIGDGRQTPPWYAFQAAVRNAAQMELDSWDTPTTFLRTYRVTRHSLGGVWEKLNIDFSELARMPEGYVEGLINEIADKLFQPILDLPWETYFDEPKPLIDYLDRVEIMSKEEMRRAYDLKIVPTMSEVNWRERGF